VNPDHARPLVAFGLLVAAATVITVTGLQTNDSATSATSATAAAAHASASASPELVLGGVLRTRPDAVLSNPLSPELWAAGSEATPSGGAVQVASPSGPTATHKARTKAGTQQTTTGGSHPSQTTTEPVSTASSDHGKGRGKPDQPARPTTTATATATPGPSDNGSKGKPDTAGR
jgi:hypothetical protein